METCMYCGSKSNSTATFNYVHVTPEGEEAKSLEMPICDACQEGINSKRTPEGVNTLRWGVE